MLPQLLSATHTVLQQYQTKKNIVARESFIALLDSIHKIHTIERFYMFNEYEGQGITVSGLSASIHDDVSDWSEQSETNRSEFFEGHGPDCQLTEEENETIRMAIEQIFVDRYGLEFELYVIRDEENGEWLFSVNEFSTGNEDF